MFANCFARVRDTEIATGWFFSAPPSGIKRENMIEWLLWAVFGSQREGLKEEWADEIEGYIRNIEKLLGRKLEEGWDQTLRCMKVSLDPVDMVHRPLLWYLVSIVSIFTLHLTLTGNSDRRYGRYHNRYQHDERWLPALHFW